MKRPTLLLSLSLLGALSANSVIAEPTPGWFTRLAVSNVSLDFEQTNSAFLSTADSRETGFDLAWGYRLGEHFALELGYGELGDHAIEVTCAPGFTCLVEPPDIEIDPSTVSLLGLAGLPLTDQLSVYAALGAAYVDTDIGDSTELKAGLGGAYQMSDELAIDLRYSQLVFDQVDDFDLLELGLVYSF